MDEVDEYENGEIYLRIKHLTNPIHNEYWLQVGGVAGLQLREQEWGQLCELVSAYNQETCELLHRHHEGSIIERGVRWLKTLWK